MLSFSRRVSRPLTSLSRSCASGPPPPRIITGASLFDGHDASINVMRRLIQAEGAEVGRVSMYFHEADGI